MSWWDKAKRVGLGVATGGLSEAGGARPLLNAAAGSDYTKDLLFGGKATAGIDAQPKQYDAATNRLGQMADTAQGRAAPVITAARPEGAQQEQSRQGMMDVAGRLGGIAGGTQAGAGELAVNRQLSAGIAGQTSAARMARGAGSALAYRNAMRNQADMTLAGAGQAAQAQMQDQAAANQQLANIYGTTRGQDIGYAGDVAQLQQQAGLANQQAQLNQTQLNDMRQIQAIGAQLGWDQARIQAELAKAGIAMQDKGILPGLIQGAGQAGMAYATGGLSMAGGGGGGGAQNPAQLMDTGGLMVPSDERIKTGIRDGGGDIAAAVRAVRPITFGYIDPSLGAGQQTGVSAQDLQRNPGLAHTVVDTPQGKKVDGGKLAAAAMAALPGVMERLDRIEALTPAAVRGMPRIAEGRRMAASIPETTVIAGDAEAIAEQERMMRRRAALAQPYISPYWNRDNSNTGTAMADIGGQ